MKEENLTYFSSLFLYSGLMIFYQVKTETFDDLLFLTEDRLDRSKLFFPLEIGLLHD